jgi:Spy/CpxP family protein refolding chaperone
VKIWQVIFASLAIFTAGILTGAVMTHTYHHPHRIFATREPLAVAPAPSVNSNREPHLNLPFVKPPGRGLAKDFLERLDKELKLDSEQRKRIEKILNESQKHTKELWEKIAPEMREEMKRSQGEIREVLTPEQNTRMDELLKRAPKPPKEGRLTNAVTPMVEQPSNPPPPEAPAK